MITYYKNPNIDNFYIASLSSSDWQEVAPLEYYSLVVVDLFNIAGTRVIIEDTPLDQVVAKYARIVDKPMKMKKMQESSCHDNCLELSSKGYEWYMGWGYTWADKTWRPHSWAVKNDTIYETTQKRNVYFGVRIK